MKKVNYYIYYKVAWTCPECNANNMGDETEIQPAPGEEVECLECGEEFEFDREE